MLCPTCHEKLERLYDERFYRELGVGNPDRVVNYVTDYLVTELDEIEHDMRRRFNEVRSNLESTHIQQESMDGDLREQISDAIGDYHGQAIDADTDGVSSKDNTDIIRDVIGRMEKEHDDGVPIEKVLKHGRKSDMSEEEVEAAIQKLWDRGEVYEPITDHLRTV